MPQLLRCHLLMGWPISGKIIVVKALAPLLTAPGEPPAVLLSIDAIRIESPDALRQDLLQRCREVIQVNGQG
jgi:hypothetical protein